MLFNDMKSAKIQKENFYFFLHSKIEVKNVKITFRKEKIQIVIAKWPRHD